MLLKSLSFCRHFKIKEDTIKFVSSELDMLLGYNLKKKYRKFEYGTGEEHHIMLMKVYDDLAKQLRSLKDLPLTIHSVQATASALRYTEVRFDLILRLSEQQHTFERVAQMPLCGFIYQDHA